MRVFYHGGVPDLRVGTYLLPPIETGRFTGARADRVYITTDILQAINCAIVETGMVYLVQPVGRLGPDDDDIKGPKNYTCRRALILARASLPPRLRDFKYVDFHAFHRDVVDLELLFEKHIALNASG